MVGRALVLILFRCYSEMSSYCSWVLVRGCSVHQLNQRSGGGEDVAYCGAGTLALAVFLLLSSFDASVVAVTIFLVVPLVSCSTAREQTPLRHRTTRDVVVSSLNKDEERAIAVAALLCRA